MATPSEEMVGKFIGSVGGSDRGLKDEPNLGKFGEARKTPDDLHNEARNLRTFMRLARARIELATQGFSVLCSTD